ncbi:hypothetical protein JYA75_03745 [Rhodococcus sp. PSBB066]|nr:hypothetical protein JQ505_02630 [Rhodococcus aetherivorans]QSE60124.1 hypothetical protein JYA75_03745 [Rhodococcus sp. PSBB066]QSE68571.1 hypothetical protein JYA91_23850 [Rhodococcus sp. PSBB049]
MDATSAEEGAGWPTSSRSLVARGLTGVKRRPPMPSLTDVGDRSDPARRLVAEVPHLCATNFAAVTPRSSWPGDTARLRGR